MKITTKLSKTSGVYIFYIEKHSYIGSSSDLYGRIKKHQSLLSLGKHHNKFVQNCYNKYHSIEFKILEICKREQLINKECNYIKLYTPDLNSKSPNESRSGFYNSEYQKEIARLLCKKNLQSRKVVDKRTKSNKGKKRSQEIRDKFKITNGNKSIQTIEKIRNSNQFKILKKEDVIKIRNRLLIGEKVINLSKEYNVSISTIYKIKQNKRWKFL